MTTSITTFLTYDTEAEEAAKLYTSLFDGKIKETRRYPTGGPTFTFTQGFSLLVQVDSQAEIDRLWKKLTENGGKEVQCGWLVDKFGVSWQIVPKQLQGMLSDKDKAKSGRAMQAMMGMRKLDLAKLQAAFEGI
jgi:predicted 3-demethylubiquinone-9 3-methyltransferase (glyoxalase superfamily)